MQPKTHGRIKLSRFRPRRQFARGDGSMLVRPAAAPWFIGLCLILFGSESLGNSLPFRTLEDSSDRFTVSLLTAPYERDLDRVLNVEEQQPTDLAVLDEHGWFPMDDVPYRTDTYDMFQQAADEVPQDPLTPEEEVAEESGTAGVQVGIPSPVAVGGSILGGLGVLASIFADWF